MKFKKQLLTLLCAFILALGCSAISFAATPQSNLVGYVDVQKVMQNYPDIQITMSAIQMEYQKAQEEFNAKAPTLDDNGKQELNNKLMEQVAKREHDLMSPIQEKVRKTIEKVAKAQGINSVVDINAMLAGGKNLTDDVIADIVASKK